MNGRFDVIKKEMRDPFYIYMVALIIVSITVYIYINFNPIIALTVSAILYPAIAAIPVIVYLLSLRKIGFGWEDKFSVMIVFQWLGSIIWLIAEIIWCWYYNLYHGWENPYPSYADIFYIAAYFPVIIGLAIYISYLYKTIRPELTKKQSIINIGTAIMAGLIVGVIYWIMVVASYAGEPIPLLEFILNVLYVFLDALLLVVIMFGFIVIRGKMGRILFLFLISCLLIIIFDVFFAYLEAYGLYYDGHPIELLDLASYLVDAMAFYEVARISR